jgi:hypothetical protein
MSTFLKLKKSFKKKRRLLKRNIHTFPLWYQEPEFIFIHINKTGGSSIEKALNLPFEHLTATEKIKQVGIEKWQQKFTFSFVRNPYDKVCSHYRYRVKTNQTKLKENPLSFAKWVQLTYGQQDPFYCDNIKMFLPQHQWMCDTNGKLLVNQVYKFENLSQDFTRLCKKLNLKATLPHLKPSKPVNYQSFYDESTKATVEAYFEQDFKMFNYKF